MIIIWLTEQVAHELEYKLDLLESNGDMLDYYNIDASDVQAVIDSIPCWHVAHASGRVMRVQQDVLPFRVNETDWRFVNGEMLDHILIMQDQLDAMRGLEQTPAYKKHKQLINELRKTFDVMQQAQS